MTGGTDGTNPPQVWIEDKILVSRRAWEELCDDSLLLSCLRVAGVDCWDGYDFAIEAYEEYKEEDNN